MMNPTVKKWLRRLFYLVVVLAFLLLLFSIALQTPTGKRLLAQSVSRLVTHYSRYALDIDGLSGTVPHYVRITTISVADNGGNLATIHDLDVSIDVVALLRGDIHVTSLQVGHVELWKRPTPQERWRIPKLPRLPGWPTVDALRLDKITLDAAVLGAPAILKATGRVQPVTGSLFPSMELEISSVNTNGVYGKLTYAHDKEMPLLSLTATDDALLPTLLKVTPPVNIVMEGKGKRADWKASFQADSGEGTLASGTLHLEEREATMLDASLQCNIGLTPILASYAALLGDTVVLNASGALDRQGVIHLAPVAVTSETTTAKVVGEVNLEQDIVALNLAVNYDNLARMAPSLPQEIGLPVLIETKLQGPFTAPELFLHILLADTEVLAGSLQLGLDTIFSVRGNLQVTPPAVLQPITGLQPEDVATIALDVSYGEDTGILQVTQLNMTGMGIDASV